MSFWGAAIGGALSLVDKGIGLYSMSKQHRYNKEFAKYVGENAHQWEVNDLRNAGLNPILSSGGSGNAGGGSHVGSLDGDLANTFTNVLNSAQQRHLVSEQVKTEKSKQEANNQTAGKAAADAQLALSQAESINLSNMLLRNDINFYSSEAGRMLRNIQLGREALGVGTNSAKNAYRLFGRF